MIVVDSSAIVNLLVERPAAPDLYERVLGAASLHAPHLVDYEVVSALRGLVLGRKLSADRATDALNEHLGLRIVRYPAERLVPRIWSMRDQHTAYDAAFLALAGELGVPLVTCDGRTRHAAGVEVEVY